MHALIRPLFLSALLLLVCLSLGSGPLRSAAAEAETGRAGKAPAAAQNGFAFDFFRVALKGSEKNSFVSPYSIWSALLMAREGAGGRTAAEMDRVLHSAGMPRAAAWRALKAKLGAPAFRDGHGPTARTRPAYELNIANALWGQERFAFEAPYLKTLKQGFGAPLERLDFLNEPAARKRINDWVADQTKDKIRNIVPEGVLTPMTRLVLANAIYFKAPWQDAFQARWTKPGPFHGPNKQESEVLFMHRNAEYTVAAHDGVRAIQLPYRRHAASMWVLLPDARDGLGALEAKLDEGWFRKLLSTSDRQRVQLYLPKWKFTDAREISGLLEGLGMATAFKPGKADFSGMTKAEELFIGAALHKAFVAVDEEGTEAAAATVLVMKGTAHRPQKPMLFRADHPFLFVIRHEATGAILFLGRVSAPTPAAAPK